MKLTVNVELTPLNLAEAFTEMNDEEQAQFFIEVTAIMGRWGSSRRSQQAYYIGGHLRTCTCSNDAARMLVREIADASEQRS